MKEDFGGQSFSMAHYLAVKSAAQELRPDKIFFHYAFEPTGFWWSKAKTYLTLRRVTPPQEIYGNKLVHVAHQADVIRLQVLLEFGGIYLDMDVIAIQSFDSLRKRPYQFVMGQEGRYGNIGLCNAVMLSIPNSPFVSRWLGEYRTFNEAQWNYHSVILPKELAQAHPHEIAIVDSSHFFYPHWDTNGLKVLFEENQSGDFSRSFAVHLWSHLSYWRYLRRLTVHKIFTSDTHFNKLTRKFLDQSLEREELESFWHETDLHTSCDVSFIFANTTQPPVRDIDIQALVEEASFVPNLAIEIVLVQESDNFNEPLKNLAKQLDSLHDHIAVKFQMSPDIHSLRIAGIRASCGRWLVFPQAHDRIPRKILHDFHQKQEQGELWGSVAFAAKKYRDGLVRNYSPLSNPPLDAAQMHDTFLDFDQPEPFPSSSFIRRGLLEKSGALSSVVPVPAQGTFMWLQLYSHSLFDAFAISTDSYFESVTTSAEELVGTNKAQRYGETGVLMLLGFAMARTAHPELCSAEELLHNHKTVKMGLQMQSDFSQFLKSQAERGIVGTTEPYLYLWTGLAAESTWDLRIAIKYYTKYCETSVGRRDWQGWWLMMHLHLELGDLSKSRDAKEQLLALEDAGFKQWL
eukprot:TRINITY_DN1890_c0_g1_i1.p1 TRINITY_DN1890_c0_g1~~TRINITY_DN1890_c0_g1_i1.p1  ORF type:complete len:630 (-),score=77.72 TRINITY_DN1890_c0_g1_i1:40-1929(-)